MKLAEENVKASLLKKVLNLSALNCCMACKWSGVSGLVNKDYFMENARLQLLLTG